MKFIEMTGATLREIMTEDEFTEEELQQASVLPTSIIRVNLQGDIELRCQEGWEVIGGLLGDFQTRLCAVTHLDWA